MYREPAHPPVVRPAAPADIPALVALRLANAARHVALAPDDFRVPDAGAVRRHFALTLGSSLITVAEVGGAVVGMAEVVLLPPPPDHQILVPRTGADIHTVVLDTHRGQGIGTALVAAAEQVAAAHGVTALHAVIFATNAPAVSFYSSRGFTPRGTMLSKSVPPRR
ncbi:GNAT family N-acetyltransferase [Lentzea sp. NPDC042327]|uniref:GNAT family N-acetyltransferase n=1 Tax=Lentzea sp. NPDC042327 TaxID=3154801 RepID=UPI0033D24FBC